MTSLAIIEKNGQSDQFWDGFLAALDFLDGADSMQVRQTSRDWVLLQFSGGDNATYEISPEGSVQFTATGVEI